MVFLGFFFWLDAVDDDAVDTADAVDAAVDVADADASDADADAVDAANMTRW